MQHRITDRGGTGPADGNAALSRAGGHPLRWCGLLALLPVLAACHDDKDCFSCGPSLAPEVSFGLVAADFQHAGHASVIATSTVLYSPFANAGNLVLYPLGGGTQTTVIPDGADPLYLASADLNGDALADVASASYDMQSISVFLNNPGTPGTFGLPIQLPSPGASQLAIADMTGDGLADIVSADFNVSLFVQISAGSFASPVPLYPGGANWVALGDLDGDGTQDVALTDGAGVKILFHAGDVAATTFASPVTPEAQSSSRTVIAIADVNGDGLNDLVITDPGPHGGGAPAVEVLLQNPAQKGGFLTAASYPVQPYSLATSIVVTDVNGDGLPDIVIGGTAGVDVLLHDPAGAGTFQAATGYAAPNANQIAVADVDGDGHPDIVVGTGVPAAAAVHGVLHNIPGVLLQNAAAPGTFGTLQSLPAPAPAPDTGD